MKQLEKPEQEPENVQAATTEADEQLSTAKKSSWFVPFLLFLVILMALAAGAYFGWQYVSAYQQQMQSQLGALQAQLASRPTGAQLDNSLRPLQQSVGRVDSRLAQLEQGQRGLQASTENLYALYGRDENGWKLAEVEYLMSIAQHKLVLENDFEGAAKTLNAASERIAELADPGLLPVRVQINEEIAQLKTRVRPDLVGMTLLVARLTRQVNSLKPGYQSQTSMTPQVEAANTEESNSNLRWDQRVMNFLSSLVTVKTDVPKAQQLEQTLVLDVTDKLEDNLKLTRWAILERDAFQYQKLMNENVSLFKEYYDLENAANGDFYEALLQLQRSPLKPELPDISGSLRLLKELQQQREQAPAPASPKEAEHG